MRDIEHNLHPARQCDAGTAAFIVWIVVFAVFMVALMALGGGSHLLTVHHFEQPALGVGPA